MKIPNILMILIDDLGWKDLSCTGSEYYETPHIDRLRSKGMLFTRAYATCPVCSPTRASLLTGKYPVATGVTDWINHDRPGDSPEGHTRGYLLDAPYLDHLPLEEYSLATALKEGGYQTWHVGKWHLGKAPYYPEHHGFDVNIGGCYIGSPQKSGYFSPWTDIEALKDADVPDGTYLTDYLTDRCLDLISTRDREKPFFLNLWYYSVHTPIEAKQELIQKYRDKAATLGLDRVEAFAEGDYYPCEHKKDIKIQRRMVQSDPVYAAMIESLDENIGRVMDYLEEKELLEDTLLVFTSDNGGLSTAEGSPTCNLPLAEGKGWLYEGGVREPWIMSWPGRIKENSLCSVPVCTTDLYPSFLEAAELPLIPEQHEDGISLMPLLRGEDSLKRDSLFWHYPHYGNQGSTPGSSILEYPWKLIEFFEDQHLELYNLNDDPGEEVNLVHTHKTRALEMQKRLHKWQMQKGTKIPKRNESFRPWSREHLEKGYQPWD